MTGLPIRRAEWDDLPALLDLYTHLHEAAAPMVDDRIAGIWRRILDDPNHYVLLGIDGERPVSSCVLVTVENLTRGQRPYALIENVVTHPDFRGRGYGGALLDRARAIASERGCYKLMLMTGSKNPATHSFYCGKGYNSLDKTAYIQWL